MGILSAGLKIRGGGRKLMKNKKTFIMGIFALLVAVALPVLAACSGGASASSSSSPAKPVWIEPEVNGETISIPLDVITTNKNIHFEVETAKGTAYYMAYVNGGKTYARANVCVPCRSINFTLDKNLLVCNSCGTTFKASDGTGVNGACVRYPKAAVPFETVSGKMVLTQADLVKAFEETLQPGLP
jgi:nitrite reductase/ring-hydroxylating ferredoxin subunit